MGSVSIQDSNMASLAYIQKLTPKFDTVKVFDSNPPARRTPCYLDYCLCCKHKNHRGNAVDTNAFFLQLLRSIVLYLYLRQLLVVIMSPGLQLIRKVMKLVTCRADWSTLC